MGGAQPYFAAQCSKYDVLSAAKCGITAKNTLSYYDENKKNNLPKYLH